MILSQEFEALADPYNPAQAFADSDAQTLTRLLIWKMHHGVAVVNSTANDSPECIQPGAPSGQLALCGMWRWSVVSGFRR